jgi:hypothetical protein
MKKQHNFWPATIAALGMTMGLIFFPVKAFAVVGNVEFVGGPGPGETISFTDDKGKETQATTQERKDDRGGVIVFVPLQGRNLPDGKYKIKWRGGETTATLGSGVNRVEFHAGGGETPRYVFNVGPITRFYSDSYGPLKASTGIRFEAGAPINYGEGLFAHQPYVALTYLPKLQFDQRRWDFDHNFQAKLSRGSTVDVSAGVQTNWDYDLPRVGGAEVYGGYNAGVRYSHSSFRLERVDFKPDFIEAHNFDKTDNAFGFEMGYRVWLQWDNGFWAGLRGGYTPTYTDALNGGRQWKSSGDVGGFIGYSWSVPGAGERQRR